MEVPSLSDSGSLEALATEYASTIHLCAEDDRANDVFMFVGSSLAEAHPDVAWEVIVRAIDLAPNARAVGMIGADALENLLSWHSESYLERSCERALVNPAFRHALENVWRFEMPLEHWRRLDAFRRAHPEA
jgi:hypothetical protein